MHELADGVYAFPLEFEFEGESRVIHPSGVETDGGLVLLDAGLPDQVDALGAHLEAAGFGFEDVRLVVITHQDGDHAGALSAVRERAGDPVVAAHPEEAPYVAGERDPLKGGDERYPPAPVDVEIVDGVAFRTDAGPLRAIETPGHTPGHVSLYLPDRELLIAADALTAPEGDLLGPSEEATLDMERAVESVGTLAGLEVERTLCYHGGPVDHGPNRIAAVYESLQ